MRRCRRPRPDADGDRRAAGAARGRGGVGGHDRDHDGEHGRAIEIDKRCRERAVNGEDHAFPDTPALLNREATAHWNALCSCKGQ